MYPETATPVVAEIVDDDNVNAGASIGSSALTVIANVRVAASAAFVPVIV